MIETYIPGFKTLKLNYLALDYNGTLSVDGILIPKVRELINEISKQLKVFIITADTFGAVDEQLKWINCEIRIISEQNQAYTKQQFIKQLGSEETVAIGNGRNDSMMLEEAALGIAVIQKEGCSIGALNSADLVSTNIIDALELLINPMRLLATLRN